MVNEYNLASSDFQSLQTVSQKIFEVISRQLNVNTAYVTKRGETAMTVLSSFNEEEMIIPEGYSVEYGGTHCRLIIMNDDDLMETENLNKYAATKDLDVTGQLDVKGFMGVTLRDLNGGVFGTLCVMDKEEKNFTAEDKAFLKSMAEILAHIIELDKTKFNMAFLNVPIIPITQGVSILAIQGVIDEYRAENIMTAVLNYGADNDIDYFIIDLSGLIILDNVFPNILFDIVNALQIMGIETIMTGISPKIAKHEVNNQAFVHVQAKTVSTLEAGLALIGFRLEEDN